MAKNRDSLIGQIESDNDSNIKVRLVHINRTVQVELRVWNRTSMGMEATDLMNGSVSMVIADMPRFAPKRFKELVTTIHSFPHLQNLYEAIVAKYPEHGWPCWDEAHGQLTGETVVTV